MCYFLRDPGLELRCGPFMIYATSLTTESQGLAALFPQGHALLCMTMSDRESQSTHETQSSVFYFCFDRVLKCAHEYLY